MNPIPHQFQLYGQTWRVIWGSSTDPFWDSSEDDAKVVDGKPRAGEEAWTITIHPKHRRNRARAWECLFHEILHIIDANEPAYRKTMPKAERERVLRHTYEKWDLQHEQMHQLDVPMGRAFVEMRVHIPCTCRPCLKKAQKEAKIV